MRENIRERTQEGVKGMKYVREVCLARVTSRLLPWPHPQREVSRGNKTPKIKYRDSRSLQRTDSKISQICG